MKVNEETTVSEEQVLFNKLSYEEQQFILKQMRLLQPCELICEIEEKKIPEKIKDKYCSQISKVELAQKYNEIIDYLKSKGE